jgi:hypothetical protein
MTSPVPTTPGSRAAPATTTDESNGDPRLANAHREDAAITAAGAAWPFAVAAAAMLLERIR